MRRSVTTTRAPATPSTVFGDDPAPPGSEVFTIAGASATAAQFEAALTNGDTVAYSRAGGVETFALTNVAPANQTGTATDVANLGAARGGSFTLANGANDELVTYTAGGRLPGRCGGRDRGRVRDGLHLG